MGMLHTTITHLGRSYKASRRAPVPDRGYASGAPAGPWVVEGIPGMFFCLEDATDAVRIDAEAREAVDQLVSRWA